VQSPQSESTPRRLTLLKTHQAKLDKNAYNKIEGTPILKPAMAKGQLISKCPFGVKTSSKKPTKIFPGFLP
jgi:hypothetical protein